MHVIGSRIVCILIEINIVKINKKRYANNNEIIAIISTTTMITIKQ